MSSINSFFKLIIYIWSHAIRFEFLYTSWNLEMDAINKFIIYNVTMGHVVWRENKEVGQWHESIQMIEWWKHALSWSFKRKYPKNMSQ